MCDVMVLAGVPLLRFFGAVDFSGVFFFSIDSLRWHLSSPLLSISCRASIGIRIRTRSKAHLSFFGAHIPGGGQTDDSLFAPMIHGLKNCSLW